MDRGKWIGLTILIGLLVAAGLFFADSGARLESVEANIVEVENRDDPEGILPSLRSEKTTLEGQRVFNGILLAFLGAGVAGILFVIYVLPVIAHRLTHAVYDSGEEVGPDPLHDARVLVAQGNYEEAIDAFREAAELDPLNRVPWVEIAKIQRDHLRDPAAAVDTIRKVLEDREWQAGDAAFFLFRLAEMYDQELHDRKRAEEMLRRVIEKFPETRHSANARHQLQEWGIAG